jgi:uncharacterized phosphosugar-binding protein
MTAREPPAAPAPGPSAPGHLARRYLDATITLLQRLRDEEDGPLRAAGALLGAALADGFAAYVFGAGHSALPAQDVVYRSGGLMLLNPLVAPGLTGAETRPVTLGTALERLPGFAAAVLDSSPARAGDVLVVVSVSGRNAVPVEMAREARRRGLRVIGIVSRAYGAAVSSRDPLGERVLDHCDVVVDDKVGYGDAVLEVDGVREPFCAASGVTNTAALNAVVAATVGELLARGVTPPIFRSVNTDGGAESNAGHLRAERHRIHFL